MSTVARAGAVAGVLLLAALILQIPDTWRTAGIVFTGRSPHCPLPNALSAGLHATRRDETKNSILANSRLLENDPAGYELWDTPRGAYWIPAANLYAFAFNLAEQALGIYRTADVSVRPGDVVLDCGANLGIFTKEALAAGARLVVAIEPAPRNLECLLRNLAPEIADGRVIVYPKGVWDSEGSLTLRVDPAETAAASFVMGQESWSTIADVPLTTIDALVDELNLPPVDFIKFDIEGAEPRALLGARKTLASHRPRLAVASYHAPDHPAVIPATARAAQPDYEVRCGSCSEVSGYVRPDVLFFSVSARKP